MIVTFILPDKRKRNITTEASTFPRTGDTMHVLGVGFFDVRKVVWEADADNLTAYVYLEHPNASQ